LVNTLTTGRGEEERENETELDRKDICKKTAKKTDGPGGSLSRG